MSLRFRRSSRLEVGIRLAAYAEAFQSNPLNTDADAAAYSGLHARQKAKPVQQPGAREVRKKQADDVRMAGMAAAGFPLAVVRGRESRLPEFNLHGKLLSAGGGANGRAA